MVLGWCGWDGVVGWLRWIEICLRLLFFEGQGG